MENIKFKGLYFNPQTKKSEMVYGDFVHNRYIKSGMPEFCIESITNIGLICYNIDIKTLSQYTGVNDKNNKEIYFGDIIKRQNKYIGVVIFENGCFKIEWKDGVYYQHARHIDDYMESSLEVIGNIIENPEILGEIN